MKDSPFFEQAKLVLRVLPLLNKESDFALKGGTAINFFFRDVPRVSVDIDLCYLPVAEREESLAAIHSAMKRIGENAKTSLAGSHVMPTLIRHTNHIRQLVIRLRVCA